jgi:hypothetical protein
MLEERCIRRGVGQDTYKVEGDIALYTDEEIADKCDFNNWGCRVLYRSSNEMEIIVYTD